MYIAEYMTSPPVTIPPEMTIPEARELLRCQRFRHLPVVDAHNALVGMVTDRDLRSAFPSSVLSGSEHATHLARLAETPVSAIMSRAFFTLTPDATLDDALILLDQERVGALPVLDDQGRVTGIFSIRDLIRAYRTLFGLGERGSAMIVVKDDGQPQSFTRIAEILEARRIVFTRLVRKEPSSGGPATIYLRVNTCNIRAVRAVLEEAGFRTSIPTLATASTRPEPGTDHAS